MGQYKGACLWDQARDEFASRTPEVSFDFPAVLWCPVIGRTSHNWLRDGPKWQPG